MKKIVCVILLCLSCVYGGGDEGFSMMLAKENIKNLRALGIGYCLGYDVEKLYDEFSMSWPKLDVDESARNAIINEVKNAVDTQKKKLTTTKRKDDEKEPLFKNCFIIDSIGCRERIQRIAEKYCVKNCSRIDKLRNWCKY